VGVIGTSIKVKSDDFKKLHDKLEKLGAAQVQKWNEDALRELAARLLRKAIMRTPVGKYAKSTGKKGGTLRRGWSVGQVAREGGGYRIEITNLTEYAPYVEYGHRTANHAGWVGGRFMLTISERELQKDAPRILLAKLKKFMGGVFDA
jgi:hypothetical protein